MVQELNWAGVARGKIVEYGSTSAESGAVSINVKCDVEEYFDPNTSEWVDVREQAFQSEGRIWIVKKDGTINQTQAQAVMAYAGWSGDIIDIHNNSWVPTPVSFTINLDKGRDGTTERYRISWLNDYNRTPGKLGTLNEEKARELQEQYGAQFRALAGNIQQAKAPPPAGKPKAPPPPQSKPKQAPKPVSKMTVDDVNAELDAEGVGEEF
jgi:hypothetical protein